MSSLTRTGTAIAVIPKGLLSKAPTERKTPGPSLRASRTFVRNGPHVDLAQNAAFAAMCPTLAPFACKLTAAFYDAEDGARVIQALPVKVLRSDLGAVVSGNRLMAILDFGIRDVASHWLELLQTETHLGPQLRSQAPIVDTSTLTSGLQYLNAAMTRVQAHRRDALELHGRVSLEFERLDVIESRLRRIVTAAVEALYWAQGSILDRNEFIRRAVVAVVDSVVVGEPWLRLARRDQPKLKWELAGVRDVLKVRAFDWLTRLADHKDGRIADIRMLCALRHKDERGKDVC